MAFGRFGGWGGGGAAGQLAGQAISTGAITSTGRITCVGLGSSSDIDITGGSALTLSSGSIILQTATTQPVDIRCGNTSDFILTAYRNSALQFSIGKFGKIFIENPGDSTGTPGAATINVPIGKSAIAAAASSVVITNSQCIAGTKVFITPLDIDATLVQYMAVATAGSFTVTGNAAATATWKFDWFLVN